MTNWLPGYGTNNLNITEEHLRQSNLIENVKGPTEILQSLKAWQFLMSRKTSISIDDVLETHRLVMLNLWPEIAGKFRTVNVEVNGHSCPHYSVVSEHVYKWVMNINAYLNDYDPIKAHVDFEHIHPFRDGNGRTGRLLLWRHEVLTGKSPTLITYDNRWQYYELFI